jgi:hypothetical protein
MNGMNRCLFAGAVVAGLAIAWTASPAQALPPDPNNAALLYYQAFLMLPQGQDQVRAVLEDLPYGVEPNDQVREYLRQCQPAFDLAVAASQIPACDWGLRYSQDFQMQMAHLAQIRRLAFLLRDDSKVLVASGHYRQALERCLTMRRMAHHVGDENLVSWLVAVAINALTDKAIRNTLGTMPADLETLVWLKSELEIVPEKPLRIQNSLRTEEEVVLAKFTLSNPNLAETVAESIGGTLPLEVTEQLKNADEAFFEGSRKYYKEHIDAVLKIVDSSALYTQKLGQLEELDKRPALEAKDNPHAILTAAFMPPIARIFTLDTRARSGDNMLKAAIEVYLVKVRTGKLPDRLPTGLPKDVFNGQDFTYATTADGFTLSRWTDEPASDKTYQFEFKTAR